MFRSKVSLALPILFLLISVTAQAEVARGESQVELLELSELNEGAYAASPWLSSDGLTIYWVRGDWDTSGVVWTAKRKDANSFFRGKKQLFPGRSPTLTEDGLQMVFLGTRSDGEKGSSLHFTRRNSIDEPFKRPREIQELQGVQRPLSPSMSPDGLTLYLNRGGFGTALRMEIVVCSRANREAPWGKPQSLPIMLDKIEKGVLTGSFITSDELSMYCVIEGRGKDRKQDNLMLWTRTSKTKLFSNFTYLTDGLPRMTCSTPRYVKATNELFVSRLISPSQLRLFVIKGFIPRSATATATAPLSLKEKQPELVVLNELDKEGAENNPWLTSDGLTIYWTVEIAPEQTRWVWTAKRKDTDALFENPLRLIPAQDFTISDDELEIIIFQNKGLYKTSRDAIGKSFKRPKKITAAVLRNGFLAGPCLSADGLTLYCDGMVKGKGPQIHVMTRKAKSSKWSSPQPLKLTLTDRMKFPYVSRNGRYLFCISRDITQGSNVIVHSRNDAKGLFRTASIVNCEGITVRGIFPRYVSATNELFIAGNPTEGGENKLMVLKNFSPETKTRSVK